MQISEMINRLILSFLLATGVFLILCLITTLISYIINTYGLIYLLMPITFVALWVIAWIAIFIYSEED